DAQSTANTAWTDVDVDILIFGSVTALDAQGRAPGIGAEIALEARLGEPTGGGATLMAFATGAAHQTRPAHLLLGWADHLRERFTAEASAMPGAGGQLLPGLAVGDTRAVDAQLEDDMKTSSLTHLTAVSGANCALV